LQFIEHMDLPFVTMIQSKGVVSEDHPNYLGVYEGAMCRPELREFVERSDCLIMLGIVQKN
jgi:indolepyruvate decarboxylase